MTSGQVRPIVIPLRNWSNPLNATYPDYSVIVTLLSDSEQLLLKGPLYVTIDDSVHQYKVRIVLLTTEGFYEFKIDKEEVLRKYPNAVITQILPKKDQLDDNTSSSSSSSSSTNESKLASSEDDVTFNLPLTAYPTTVARDRLKKRIGWTDVAFLEPDPKDVRAFYIHFFSGSVASQALSAFSQIARLFTGGGEFSQFLKVKRFRCSTAFEAMSWLTVCQRLLRDVWQKTFESDWGIIPVPEIYQRHAFVSKKVQDRILLISNRWIYNLEVTYKPTTLRTIKWAIPIVSLTHIEYNTESNSPMCTIYFDNKEAIKHIDENHPTKTKFSKHGHSWTYLNVSERNRIIMTLQHLYKEITATNLTMKAIKSVEKEGLAPTKLVHSSSSTMLDPQLLPKAAVPAL